MFILSSWHMYCWSARSLVISWKLLIIQLLPDRSVSDSWKDSISDSVIPYGSHAWDTIERLTAVRVSTDILAWFQNHEIQKWDACRHCIGSQYPMSNITIDWETLGYESGDEMEVRDLFAEEDLGTAKGSLTLSVDIHDARMVKLQPKMLSPRHHAWRPWHIHRLGSQHLSYDDNSSSRTSYK